MKKSDKKFVVRFFRDITLILAGIAIIILYASKVMIPEGELRGLIGAYAFFWGYIAIFVGPILFSAGFIDLFGKKLCRIFKI